jgi:hypothetical protein
MSAGPGRNVATAALTVEAFPLSPRDAPMYIEVRTLLPSGAWFTHIITESANVECA